MPCLTRALALCCLATATAQAASRFAEFKTCQQCVEAGWGWSAKLNRCGGFSNTECPAAPNAAPNPPEKKPEVTAPEKAAPNPPEKKPEVTAPEKAAPDPPEKKPEAKKAKKQAVDPNKDCFDQFDRNYGIGYCAKRIWKDNCVDPEEKDFQASCQRTCGKCGDGKTRLYEAPKIEAILNERMHSDEGCSRRAGKACPAMQQFMIRYKDQVIPDAWEWEHTTAGNNRPWVNAINAWNQAKATKAKLTAKKAKVKGKKAEPTEATLPDKNGQAGGAVGEKLGEEL